VNIFVCVYLFTITDSDMRSIRGKSNDLKLLLRDHNGKRAKFTSCSDFCWKSESQHMSFLIGEIDSNVDDSGKWRMAAQITALSRMATWAQKQSSGPSKDPHVLLGVYVNRGFDVTHFWTVTDHSGKVFRPDCVNPKSNHT